MKKLLSFIYGLISFIAFGCVLVASGVDPVYSLSVAVVLGVVLPIITPVKEFILFTSICGGLGANIKNNCDNPVQAGTVDRLVVINFADLLSVTRDPTTKEITGIVLNSGAVAYEIDGQNNSIEPMAQMVEQGFNNMFDHAVRAKGFDIDQAVKNELDTAKDGRFICICENYYRGDSGNTAFEIYGLTTGLEITEIARDPNSEETQGAFDIYFFTKKNKEPKLPVTLFDTDYATTKAIVDGLLV